MEITFDKQNYRKHNAKNKKIIRKSLEELGAGRSVVVDNEDCLVAGNGVYEQAQALKMPVRVVETDGSELVVVKTKETNLYLDPGTLFRSAFERSAKERSAKERSAKKRSAKKRSAKKRSAKKRSAKK